MPVSAGEKREAHLTFTDGMSRLPLTLVQMQSSGITGTPGTAPKSLTYDKASQTVTGNGSIAVFDQLGRKVTHSHEVLDASTLPKGIYIASDSESVIKFIK